MRTIFKILTSKQEDQEGSQTGPNMNTTKVQVDS